MLKTGFLKKADFIGENYAAKLEMNRGLQQGIRISLYKWYQYRLFCHES